MNTQKTRLIIFFFLLSHQVFAGGPWVQKEGQGYFKLSEWWIVFDQHYTGNGMIDPNVTTGIFNTYLYGEYGFSNNLTGIVNASIFSRNYMNNLRSGTTNEILVPGEALNSIGDIDLGLKYGLTKSNAKIPVAISLFLGLPTGNSSGGSQMNLQTGDGEFNQMLQIDAGYGFKIAKTPAYFSSYVAINNRTKQFSEEFRYGLELGLGFFKKRLWLSAKINAIESFKNGATAETTTSTSIFANNTEFTSFAFEANCYLTKRWGISVNRAGAFKGEIIAAAPSYSVGIFFDMSK